MTTDLLLAAVLLAAVAWLYRSRPRSPAAAPAAPPRPAAPPGRRRLADRLRGYYPRVTRQAGFDPAAVSQSYWLGKAALGLLLPLLLLEILPRGLRGSYWLALFVPALAGFLLPDLWLILRRRQRRRQIARALGYFVDLLVAFLYSGMSLERAFNRAGREGFERNHPLSRELLLVGRELDAGQDPGLAFQALAERTGVPELRGIAAALSIGLRVGTPVRATLQAQSEMLWTKRREAALKQINAAAAKVMFPVMLCGFPIFFLLTFFPAFLEILELLRGVRSGL
ncbi:MAG TPA: type II secretion system F family protein [Thermoanaerobaculia bacterium]